MQRLLTILCIAAPVFPAFVRAGDEPKREPAKPITVPFELIKTQHMVVSVKVNGKGPYRLVFDTGAPDSLVSNKVAKEANLFPKDFKKPLFALFGSMGQMKINELDLGDLKAENVSTMVLDHPTVQAISNFVGPIEGILGFTFYARYKLSIDYQTKVMTFEPGAYRPTGNMIKMMEAKLLAPKSVREAAPILAPAGLLGIRVEKPAADEEPGVIVKVVMPESPAAAAGFKVGDRLLTLDGRWTDAVTDCYIATSQIRPGTPAVAVVTRDGNKHKLTVTIRPGL